MLEFLNSIVSSCTPKADGDTLQCGRTRAAWLFYIFFNGETEPRMRGTLGQRGDGDLKEGEGCRNGETRIDRLMSCRQAEGQSINQKVRDRERSHRLRLHLLSGSRPLESQSVRRDGGGKGVG